jgi:hypothetical protein
MFPPGVSLLYGVLHSSGLPLVQNYSEGIPIIPKLNLFLYFAFKAFSMETCRLEGSKEHSEQKHTSRIIKLLYGGAVVTVSEP